MAQIDTTESDAENILATAKSRFDLAVQAEYDIRKLALEDLKFGAGDQWEAAPKNQRERQQRPILTINKMAHYIHQLVNDQRQNRPAPKVSPVDDKADIETAKILQGLIRQIERSSRASLAYTTAFDSAVRIGFGYWRILTRYSDAKSFDQDIVVEPITNRFSVYLDPHSRLPDGSDANWGFIFEDIAKDEFKRLYPNAKLSSVEDWTSEGDTSNPWITDKSARVGEYFFKDYEKKTLVLLSNGDVVLKDEIGTRVDQQVAIDEITGEPVLVSEEEVLDLPEGVEIVDERETEVPTVKWVKLTGNEILEETDWLGSSIPIIKVTGSEINVDGKRILEGVIRQSKDSQRMYNYMKSSEAEAIALAPKAPWIIAEGQFEGYEDIWASANSQPHSYLPYKQTDVNGQVAPPPQRNTFEPAIQAISQATMMASDDIKATTGMYDGAMGARSNETSGIAIRARANQAQTSNFHFTDNLALSIGYSCQQMIELIQVLYTAKRVFRTLGEDGQETVRRIGEMFGEVGKEKPLDLSIGKYDVAVSTGPSFETKRQEAASSMLELTKSIPAMANAAGDLIVKSLDLPDSQELSERLKKALPPGMIDDPKQQKIPPQVQAQMQQMGQTIEGLTGKLNEAQDKIDNKTLELESKERIAMQGYQVQLQIEMARIDAKDALALFSAEIAQLEGRINLLRQNEPFSMEQENPSIGMPDQPPEPMGQPLTGEPSPGQFME